MNKNVPQNRFIILNHWMLGLNLSLTELLVFAVIFGLDRCSKDGCFASNEYIAYFARTTPNTVSNAISVMLSSGLVERSFNTKKRRKLKVVIDKKDMVDKEPFIVIYEWMLELAENKNLQKSTLVIYAKIFCETRCKGETEWKVLKNAELVEWSVSSTTTVKRSLIELMNARLIEEKSQLACNGRAESRYLLGKTPAEAAAAEEEITVVERNGEENKLDSTNQAVEADRAKNQWALGMGLDAETAASARQLKTPEEAWKAVAKVFNGPRDRMKARWEALPSPVQACFAGGYEDLKALADRPEWGIDKIKSSFFKKFTGLSYAEG